MFKNVVHVVNTVLRVACMQSVLLESQWLLYRRTFPFQACPQNLIRTFFVLSYRKEQGTSHCDKTTWAVQGG